MAGRSKARGNEETEPRLVDEREDAEPPKDRAAESEVGKPGGSVPRAGGEVTCTDLSGPMLRGHVHAWDLER